MIYRSWMDSALDYRRVLLIINACSVCLTITGLWLKIYFCFEKKNTQYLTNIACARKSRYVKSSQRCESKHFDNYKFILEHNFINHVTWYDVPARRIFLCAASFYLSSTLCNVKNDKRSWFFLRQPTAISLYVYINCYKKETEKKWHISFR